MARVKTLDKSEFNQKRAVGFGDGSIEFDENGFSEVEDSPELRNLCAVSATLQLVSVEKVEEDPDGGEGADPVETTEPIATETTVVPEEIIDPVVESEDTDITQTEDTDNTPVDQVVESTQEHVQDTQDVSTEMSQEEKEALTELLKEKTLKELKQLLVDAEVDDKEFASKQTKAPLISLIIEKNII